MSGASVGIIMELTKIWQEKIPALEKSSPISEKCFTHIEKKNQSLNLLEK